MKRKLIVKKILKINKQTNLLILECRIYKKIILHMRIKIIIMIKVKLVMKINCWMIKRKQLKKQ